MFSKVLIDESAINIGDRISLILDLKQPIADDGGGSNSVVYGKLNAIGKEGLIVAMEIEDDDDGTKLVVSTTVPYSKIATISRYTEQTT